MSFPKVVYKDQETIITAKNMNDIQDAILTLEDGLFTMEGDRSGEIIAITDASNRGFRSLNIFGKTTQNGTPTPDAPVELVSVENPMLGLYGKNLFTSYSDSTKTENGITFSVNGNGSITISGTATASAQFNMFALYELPPAVRPGVPYIVSGATSEASIHIYELQDNWVRITDTTNQTTFALSNNAKGVLIRYVVQPNTAVGNLTVYPMLRLASVADDTYEQSKPAQAAMFNRTLHGIPVTSGGNYTDANGQQWVCDEIDFARGVYVQRIKKKRVSSALNWSYSTGTSRFHALDNDYTSGSTWGNLDILCTHFVANHDGTLANLEITHINDSAFGFAYRYDALNGDVAAWKAFLDENEVYIVAELRNHIETPLPEEELAAYTSLRTYKDNTTVSNDAGAYMELEYVMDAKKYIDGLMTGTIVPATVE